MFFLLNLNILEEKKKILLREEFMTQEDRQLLLADLCGRLPYGTIIQEYNEEYGYADNALNTIGIGYFSIHEACIEGTWINRIENVRPYLRPMSSMTEEERNKFQNQSNEMLFGCIFTPDRFDWLNKNMFDYRGLIEKGLALEAPDGMYK